MELKGKKAIVLGGSSGIGLAAATQLADGGASVVAVSRNPQRAKDLVRAGVFGLFQGVPCTALHFYYGTRDSTDKYLTFTMLRLLYRRTSKT